MSNTLLLFEITIILTAFMAVGLVFLTPEPGLETCQQATYPHYELTGHYNLMGALNCLYETLPEYEYDFCTKRFSRTKNHGKILTQNTCPGGN